MGQEPKKFHITDEGNIYRINDDGSFTSMGNVEKLSESETKVISDTVNNQTLSDDKPIKPITHNNSHKRILGYFVILVLLLLLGGVITYLFDLSGTSSAINSSVASTDSVAVSETRGDIISSEETEPVQELKFLSVQDLPTKSDMPTSPETTPNEKDVDNSSIHLSNDATNRTQDDYNPDLAYGQMEGPNNFYVLFPEGKTHLCSAHKARIDRMIKNVGSFMDKKIVVDGFLCSYTGTFESNMQDARQRTSNVVKYLKEKGVPDNIILMNTHEINNSDFGHYGHVSVMIEYP